MRYQYVSKGYWAITIFAGLFSVGYLIFFFLFIFVKENAFGKLNKEIAAGSVSGILALSFGIILSSAALFGPGLLLLYFFCKLIRLRTLEGSIEKITYKQATVNPWHRSGTDPMALLVINGEPAMFAYGEKLKKHLKIGMKVRLRVSEMGYAERLIVDS